MPSILVGTSEAPLREMLRVLFTREGFDLELASDGAGVLAIARVGAPKVVVLGSRLTDLSPYDVCRTVKSGEPAPYCILLTGEGQTVDRTNALEAGFDDFHFIPFSPTALVRSVRRALVGAA
jgi:two-component system catabolic regulation response regulator CreB